MHNWAREKKYHLDGLNSCMKKAVWENGWKGEGCILQGRKKWLQDMVLILQDATVAPFQVEASKRSKSARWTPIIIPSQLDDLRSALLVSPL